jgi:hypothetical protein
VLYTKSYARPFTAWIRGGSGSSDDVAGRYNATLH